MTNQEKKAYLQRYRYLEQRIQRKVEEIQRWRERAMTITPQYTQTPGGSGGNKLQGAVEMIVLLCDDLQQEVAELLEEGEEVRQAIETVPDSVLRLLLKYRYLDGYSWPEVSKAMKYDERWVRRLHGRALETMLKIDPGKPSLDSAIL